MITSGILDALFSVLSTILSPLTSLSNVSLPTDIASAIGNASGYYNSLNSIIPVDTMLTIFGVFLAFELGYFTWKAIMWAIRKIPSIN